MTKLTYAQQLAHPLWQRRRLEMLSAANWSCSCCQSTTETLHVHHRQYFKDRMAWEYSNVELQVLCKACHKSSHALDDDIKALLILVPPREAYALLAGYFFGLVPDSMVYKAANLDVDVMGAGFLASDSRSATPAQLNQIDVILHGEN